MRSAALSQAMLLTLISAAQTGPGGIGSSSNNVLWLDANYGVSHLLGAVSSWSDRSGNANHAYLPVTIPLGTPNLATGTVNGYPSLDFDGVDDQLWVTDHATLALTQWHFFLVVRVDVQKDYNAWMVKGDDSDENFEMLSYSDGNIHAPTKYTDGTRTFPSSAAGQVTTTAFNIIEYSYKSTVGRDIYKNGASIHTDNESKTPKTNNRPLYIGNERGTLGRVVNGDIAEVIAYNAPLNSAQRILLNNYLAAKYNRSLAAGDYYVQDEAVNGNYDHDVAGIGRVDASNIQSDSQGSGILRINNPSGLGNDEFLIWGHDNGALGAYGSTDFPAGLQGRLHRVWRASEVNASGGAVNVGNIDMTWDLAGLGPVTASHLRLLVDTDGDGTFADETAISGASHVSGTLYRFSGVSAIANGRRFTLGTTNIGSTPLPIELIAFTAAALDATTVQAEWATASESHNAYFTLERSVDLEHWVATAQVPGAGDSNIMRHYHTTDGPVTGEVLYYRLRQTDFDGASTLSDVVPVSLKAGVDAVRIFPNPSDGPTTLSLPLEASEAVSAEAIDAAGRAVPLVLQRVGEGCYRFDSAPLRPGAYLLRVLGDDGTQRIGRFLR